MSGGDVHGPQGDGADPQRTPDAGDAERDAAADAARAGADARSAADAAAEAAAAVKAAAASDATAAAELPVSAALTGDVADAPAVEIPAVSDSLLGELDGGVDAPFPQRRRRRRDAIEAAIEAAAPVGAAHPGQLPDDAAPVTSPAPPAGSEHSGYGGLAALIYGGLGVLLAGAVIAIVWLASGLG